MNFSTQLNKAILAGSIVVAAVAILFGISQFTDFGLGRGISLPVDLDLPGQSNPNDRNSVDDDAFRVGQVSTVEASDSEMSLPELFEFAEKSVVQITDSSETDAQDSRLGSGFVYDNNGHIITNHHVVNGGGRIDVTFLDGTVYRATLIGSDPYTDLAVLYVEDAPADKLAALPLANSSNLRVGEQVAAIGNPFGLSGSMSSGIISGLGRLIPAQESGSFSIPDVIQTDAPINPGNSGGPLLDLRGQVVGINSAIFSTTGQFAGVGFAVPSNTINKVVPTLITQGSFSHPWLGVSGTDMTPGIAEALGLQEPRGFLVVDVVAGSPAERAGIRGGTDETTVDGRPIALGGDVIISVDNRQVRKIDDILVYLQQEKSVGDEMVLTVLRDGSRLEITATLGSRPGLLESP